MRNEAWQWRPLGDLFEIGAGKTMSASAREGSIKTPFLRTSNVLWDDIDLSVVDRMTIPLRELAEKQVRRGDLLVCEGGEIGRAAIWNGEIETMSFQNHLHRLRPIGDAVEPRFYVYFLQSAFTQLGIFEGAGNKTTIPNLSRSRLAALDVPYPSHDEQKAIVRALVLIRNAIKTHHQATTVAQELKRTTMRELFTRGLRSEGQKETEIGPVPDSWKLVPIGSLGEVITGTTPPTKDASNYAGGEVSFVSPGDIQHGSPVERTEKHITQRGLSLARNLPQGTTCFVCIGSTIGKVGLTTADVCATNQQINAIIPSAHYDREYIFHLMTYWSDYVRRHASPSPVPILSKGAFEQIEIYTTRDTGEQREIGEILDAIGRKVDLHKRKRDVLDELFRSLLHKLMTGEIHVDELSIPEIRQ